METRSPFDLQLAVEDWRNQLLRTGLFKLDDVDELESHLLDELDSLSPMQIEDKERFLIARSRMGRLDVIAAEYAKVNVSHSLLKKLEPYVKGALIYVTLSACLGFLVAGVGVLTKLWNQGEMLTYSTIGSGIAFVAALAFGILQLYKRKRLLKVALHPLFLIVSFLLSKIGTFMIVPILYGRVNIESLSKVALHVSINNLLFLVCILLFFIKMMISKRSKMTTSFV
ncbi:MAG: hypothetical protein AAGI23_06235 [Bacteroidota bacterium]